MVAQTHLKTLKTATFIQPAEWLPHSAVWLAWPSHENLWQESLPLVRKEFTDLCAAIADPDENGHCRGEKLEIILNQPSDGPEAERALKGLGAHFHNLPFGDIWLRDTGPIFVHGKNGAVTASSFRFNGWGEKYLLPRDDGVSLKIAELSGLPVKSSDWILEGGSIEVDGEGTCLTTEQCLLNPNRNPGLDRQEIEKKLFETLGVTQTIWLKRGLLNDHTDGHIDTLARFVAPGKVVCMRAKSKTDPNFEALEEIYADLLKAKDSTGRSLEVIAIPAPETFLDEDGEVMPASYVNFYIGNSTVVVPTYGNLNDREAVEAVGRCFPSHRTVGLSAKHILEGGGAFHCISQQQPSAKGE